MERFSTQKLPLQDWSVCCFILIIATRNDTCITQAEYLNDTCITQAEYLNDTCITQTEYLNDTCTAQTEYLNDTCTTQAEYLKRGEKRSRQNQVGLQGACFNI